MSAEALLARLEGVRDRGRGQYLARCPSHKDRSPSLSVRETDAGTVLLRCFAGCSAQDVVQAVGLEMTDLFPDKSHRSTRRDQHRLSARDALEIVRHDAMVCGCVVGQLLRGDAVSDNDLERCQQAVMRINRVTGAAYGI